MSLGLKVSYGVVLEEAARASQGLTLGAELGLWRGWALHAGYAVLQPTRLRRPQAELIVAPHPILLGARGSHRVGRLRLGGALTLAADYSTLRLAPLQAGVRAGDTGDEWLLSLWPQAQLGWAVLPALELFVSLGARVPLNPLRYQVRDRVGTHTWLESWPVQPSLSLGFARRLL